MGARWKKQAYSKEAHHIHCYPPKQGSSIQDENDQARSIFKIHNHIPKSFNTSLKPIEVACVEEEWEFVKQRWSPTSPHTTVCLYCNTRGGCL